MAETYHHPAERPNLPPVPPQLRNQSPASRQSNQARPPLPPVPTSYRSQTAAEQNWPTNYPQQPPSFSATPTPSLTADNLRQADYYNSLQTQLLPPPRAHSTRPLQTKLRPEPNQLSRAHSQQSLGSPNHPASQHHGAFLEPDRPSPPLIARPDSQELAYYPPSFSSPALATGSTPKPISLPVVDLDLLTTLYDECFKARPDPVGQVKWASKVLKFIERSNSTESSSSSSAPVDAETSRISDPTLVRYTDLALKTVLKYAEQAHQTPAGGAEALYIRGDLSSTGAFPSYRVKDLKSAFRDFEAAAQLGFHLAWFRIGREYEMCEDWDRAVGAYEHGLALGECACIYRLGMCHLLGQINLPVDLIQAVGYLKTAAQLADEETPQPAYIYGMLLAGEFESLPQIPNEILRPNVNESKQMIEKAAYLGFAAAQYKIGWCYEYSQMNCNFDPLLSVEYYSLASKQGESEADMALSKWFLCGAEGHFRPNEKLAVTFAEKAAKKGLSSAMFAIGYYLEVGIGGKQDGAAALEWYRRAWEEGGNTDARERLGALTEGGLMLSRDEHAHHVDERLVHKHTLAAERNPLDVVQPTGLRRRETMRKVEEARRVAEMGMLATTLEPARGGSSRSPSPSATAASHDSPTQRRFVSQQNSERNSSSQPSTPPGPPNQQQRPSLGGQPSSSRPQRPLEHKQSQGQLRAVNRLNGYQLTDDAPPVPSVSTPRGSNNRVDHITTTNSKAGSNQKPVQFNSFADMGIQTAKAKKSEDCIIV